MSRSSQSAPAHTVNRNVQFTQSLHECLWTRKQKCRDMYLHGDMYSCNRGPTKSRYFYSLFPSPPCSLLHTIQRARRGLLQLVEEHHHVAAAVLQSLAQLPPYQPLVLFYLGRHHVVRPTVWRRHSGKPWRRDCGVIGTTRNEHGYRAFVVLYTRQKLQGCSRVVSVGGGKASPTCVSECTLCDRVRDNRRKATPNASTTTPDAG